MLPDDSIKMRRAKKVVDNGTGPFAVPLAQLTESIITNDKLDQLLAKEAPEMPKFPEIKIPEFPSEITLANLPDVQKVEITNLPKEKDDKEVKKLLQELVTEVKKKEQYTYDIEVDSDLKEQLRGEQGVPGRDGTEITAQEVRDKLESLQGKEQLDVSAIKGIEELAREIAEKEVKKVKPVTKIYSGGVGSSSSSGVAESFETVSANLDASDAVLNYDVGGNITDIVYSNGITKTFNYTGEDITSIILSGSTPGGISLTKTLTYTSGDVTGIAYT